MPRPLQAVSLTFLCHSVVHQHPPEEVCSGVVGIRHSVRRHKGWPVPAFYQREDADQHFHGRLLEGVGIRSCLNPRRTVRSFLLSS